MPPTPQESQIPRSRKLLTHSKTMHPNPLSTSGMDQEPGFAERVRSVVRRVPRGKVIAYGGVAALLGTPRAARGVGHVLSTLPEGSDVPWWRVVNARGGISLHGYPGMLQRLMLEAEGVRFGRGGLIDWKEFGWRPDLS